MKIQEVMTRNVISVGKNDSLSHVIELMRKHAITKLPVMEGKTFVGIVTDNTIAYKLGSIRKRSIVASRLHASSVMEKDVPTVSPYADVSTILKSVGEPGPTMLPVLEDGRLVGVVTKADLLPLVSSKAPITSVMQRQLHTVSPEERIIHARRLLIDKNIARLPVLTQQKLLVGLISDFEIACAFAELKKEPLAHQRRSLDELLVADAMRSPVISHGPGLSAAQAAKLMMEQNIGSLPILDNDRLIGLVTRTDLLKTITL